jgi:hypothetical protein
VDALNLANRPKSSSTACSATPADLGCHPKTMIKLAPRVARPGSLAMTTFLPAVLSAGQGVARDGSMINIRCQVPDLARLLPPLLTWADRSCQVLPGGGSFSCHLHRGPLGPGGGRTETRSTTSSGR